jgi:16S rRNA G966 N2-methylase RsmD
LSRGADRVTFFEADRGAAERLQANIRTLKAEDRSVVITRDLFRWMSDPKIHDAATLLFLDPPYRYLRERPDDLRTLATNLAARHLSAGATIVFRHDANDALDLPPLKPEDVRTYGQMAVEFLRFES